MQSVGFNAACRAAKALNPASLRRVVSLLSFDSHGPPLQPYPELTVSSYDASAATLRRGSRGAIWVPALLATLDP